jgi:hypothetical protein
MSPDKKAGASPPKGAPAPGRGRPRLWSSARERRQEHQARRRERERQVTALLHALRNARWEDPEFQRIITDGDDLAVLTALTEYYRSRHWMHRPRGTLEPNPSPLRAEKGAA